MKKCCPPISLASLALVVCGLFVQLDPALAQTQLIKHGSDEEAAAYYEKIAADLGFPVDESSLTDLIAYLGQDGLSARDLEVTAPEDLADRPILATRYLAPRIVDISDAPPYPAGWRKMVRINASPGSPADAAGIASAWLLFDYLRPQDDPEPFPGPDSGDDRLATIIQALAVPRAGNDALSDGVYFMLFEGQSTDYASARMVPENFDLPPDPKSEGAGFYVPTACGRCHGDVGSPSGASLVFEAGKLNFLDTDYLHDRTEEGDFFTEAGSLHGVLFDGGTNEASDDYAAAFEVVRTLNAEIAAQNEAAPVAANTQNYQLFGVQKWLELHANSVAHAPPMDRSLGEPDERWSSEYPEDGPLLALLSRHCYRCHNTIDFNVFLKPRFKGVAKSSISSVMFGIMPAGHALNAQEPDEAGAIVEGLKQLLAQR